MRPPSAAARPSRAPLRPRSRKLPAALAALALLAAPFAAAAESRVEAETTLIAATTLRPGMVLDRGHLDVAPGAPSGGQLSLPEQAIGLETRVALYRGRAIRAEDLGPPTLVRRNDIVRLTHRAGPLSLVTEGRALDDGGEGQRIRVMNLDSRRTVYGMVVGGGHVETSR